MVSESGGKKDSLPCRLLRLLGSLVLACATVLVSVFVCLFVFVCILKVTLSAAADTDDS